MIIMQKCDRRLRNAVSVGMVWLVVCFITACATNSTEVQYPVEYTPPGEFLLGPEDVLVVTVWRNQDLSRNVVVRPDGSISMPLIGDVAASGTTSNELARKITDRLKEFVSTPTVSVEVKEVNSYFVYVSGQVMRPGKYPLKSYATIMQGISLGGGFTLFAKKNDIRVLRVSTNGSGQPHQIEVPVHYDDIVAGKGNPGNFYLKSGDVIVVP